MLLGKSRKLSDELLRYVIAGGLSFAVEVGGYSLCFYVLVLGTVPSTVLGHIASILVNYVLNAFWVFQNRRLHRVSLELPSFAAIALVALGINVGVMYGAETWLAWTGLWAKVPASCCVVLWAYTAKRVFLFPSPRPEAELP